MAGSGLCQERTGFLFSHNCDCLAAYSCASCGKEICDRHMHETESGTMCTTCAKATRRASREPIDDPYFYSGSYYRGYGRYQPGFWGYHHYHHHHVSDWHDRDDFTEADAESVQAEGDEGFEQDMGAS
ncbi:MAG: hypothetical protein ABIG44_12215 [Planctomycetota bacterium]